MLRDFAKWARKIGITNDDLLATLDEMNRKSLTQTLVDSTKELRFPKMTVDHLEELNIPKVRPLKPKDIKNLRINLNASQGVFARYLNVNPSTLQKWEQGTVKPQAAALKLLNILQDRGVELLLAKKSSSRKSQ